MTAAIAQLPELVDPYHAPERIGLVEVGRDAGGRRVYDRQALARVVFVTRLRRSDMPIRDIARPGWP